MTTVISDAVFNLKEFWGVKYLYFLSSFPSLFWIEKINAILTEFVVGDRGHATVMCLMGLMTDNATTTNLTLWMTNTITAKIANLQLASPVLL